ncbi:MAG: DUF2235 domain-containing protein [Candidatus Scalindua sp.]|jgi:uncharacterized protein (DUF2235 family)|nr:DUF2235 domain-containing protein [Candidatus Scalindua sp.]MBT6227256.1 DUF2235 domain-containing protein [Candidatus Scalindua sp.]
MSKNIILFADGTGNKGGYTPESNVYKMYNAIDLHDSPMEQITFYDDGVGTQKNKYLRGLSGALGFGFRTNVCDLYEFLARNYEDGDQVYLMGFSRGAATVRAFAGFVATCGLVKGIIEDSDGNKKKLDRKILQERVKDAFDAYVRLQDTKLQKTKLQTDEKKFLVEQKKFIARRDEYVDEQKDKGISHGTIPIKFLGVWDTVSSLGFPQKWDITSLGMFVLNAFFMSLDRLSEFGIFRHRFYNYELTDKVEYACQALAIDDERTSFWPMVWNEMRHSNSVEQVWFAGMHSNVGGGYRRPGMANVALEWMMTKSKKRGLVLKEDALKKAHDDANVHGRIYNSRDGLAIYYRYHPRDIETLSKDKLKGASRIKIHESVINRMERRTSNYAPENLPLNFDVVDTTGAVKKTTSKSNEKDRKESIRKIKRCVWFRKILYGLFLESTIAVAVFAWCFKDITLQKGDGLMDLIAKTLDSVLPDFVNGLITVAVIQHPSYFWGAVSVFAIYGILRKSFRLQTVETSEKLRAQVLKSLQ